MQLAHVSWAQVEVFLPTERWKIKWYIMRNPRQKECIVRTIDMSKYDPIVSNRLTCFIYIRWAYMSWIEIALTRTSHPGAVGTRANTQFTRQPLWQWWGALEFESLRGFVVYSPHPRGRIWIYVYMYLWVWKLQNVIMLIVILCNIWNLCLLFVVWFLKGSHEFQYVSSWNHFQLLNSQPFAQGMVYTAALYWCGVPGITAVMGMWDMWVAHPTSNGGMFSLHLYMIRVCR